MKEMLEIQKYQELIKEQLDKKKQLNPLNQNYFLHSPSK